MGNRLNSQSQVGTDDARTSQSSRSNRTTGGLDEQLQSSSRRNNSEKTDLQLSVFPLEQEQINIIDEAENVQNTSSAFSFDQKDIDNILRVGENTDNLR